MRQSVFAVGLLMVVSLGCEQPVLVTFNQRLFTPETMEPQGGGCSVFELRGGGRSGGTLGGAGSNHDLLVSMRQTDEALVIEVVREPLVISSKTYDESFFEARTLDEYVASVPSGSALLLRHWGAIGGVENCTPLEQDGPPK